MKLRLWLIRLLCAGRPVAMNLVLNRGLCIDGKNSTGGFYYNIRVNYKRDLPEDVGMHISA